MCTVADNGKEPESADNCCRFGAWIEEERASAMPDSARVREAHKSGKERAEKASHQLAFLDLGSCGTKRVEWADKPRYRCNGVAVW
jgi:hypothetical protein